MSNNRELSLSENKAQSIGDLQHFDEILLEAIDKGLMTLGESSKTIIYYHIQNRYSLRKEDIPKKLECFALAVRCLLGNCASFIEALVLKNLCDKYGLEYKSLEAKQFQAAVEEIKNLVDRGNSIL